MSVRLKRGRPKSLGARFAATLALGLRAAFPEQFPEDPEAAQCALEALRDCYLPPNAEGKQDHLPRQDCDSVTRYMRAIRSGREQRIEFGPVASRLLLMAAADFGQRWQASPRLKREVRVADLWMRSRAERPKETDSARVKWIAAQVELHESTIRRYLRSAGLLPPV